MLYTLESKVSKSASYIYIVYVAAPQSERRAVLPSGNGIRGRGFSNNPSR